MNIAIRIIKGLKLSTSPHGRYIRKNAMLPLMKSIIKMPNMLLSSELIPSWPYLYSNRLPLRGILSSLSSFKCLWVCIKHSGGDCICWQGSNRPPNLNREWHRWCMMKAGWAYCCWLLSMGRVTNWLLLFTIKGPAGAAVLSARDFAPTIFCKMRYRLMQHDNLDIV